MCLSVAVHRPSDVLGHGKHAGHEWMVVHNRMGYRCGYVRLDKSHPWFGLGYDDVPAEVHGGLTFSEPDVPCGKGGADDGWWLGFDAAHLGDARDEKLATKEYLTFYREIRAKFGEEPGTIRSQKYIEAECRSLCKQAAAAKE